MPVLLCVLAYFVFNPWFKAVNKRTRFPPASSKPVHPSLFTQACSKQRGLVIALMHMVVPVR